MCKVTVTAWFFYWLSCLLLLHFYTYVCHLFWWIKIIIIKTFQPISTKFSRKTVRGPQKKPLDFGDIRFVLHVRVGLSGRLELRLIFHVIRWKNRIRTMTFWVRVLLGSLRGMVLFGFLHIIIIIMSFVIHRLQ